MAASLTIYCLEQLTDYADFERLCHDLMTLEGYSSLEPLGGFKDKGRDAIHVSKSDVTTIFAYSVREDWQAKLAEDSGKISKHGHTCNELIFVTTAQPTSTERDKWISDIQSKFGWKLEIYGSERLRVLLDIKHSQIKKIHPSIFPPEFLTAQEQIGKISDREHIFISYAPEDRVIVDWLVRKLTAEGYRIWCEQLDFVVGEKFPVDIHNAIQKQIFCMVALYSKTSLSNADIVLQRTLAIGLKKEQGENFLIPLLINDIQAQNLDGLTNSLKFISFKENWAEGLKQLFLKLELMNCPKPLLDGKGIVAASLLEKDVLTAQEELLVSNYLRIEKIPKIIYRFQSENAISNEEVEQLKSDWVFRKVDSKFFLSFFGPPTELKQKMNLEEVGRVLWEGANKINGIYSSDLISELLCKSLTFKCFQKGLLYCKESKLQYFPQELLTNDRLSFTQLDGSKSNIKVCSTRTFRRGSNIDKYIYHIAPTFCIQRNIFDNFSAFVRIRIRLSDVQGQPLKKRLINSRRKDLCKNWWNSHWLKRLIAVCQFLSNEDNKIVIGEIESEQIVIHGNPVCLGIPVSINEDAIEQFKKDRFELLSMLNDDDEFIEDDENQNE
jgi:TIR domain